jgi:hypothetical protein
MLHRLRTFAFALLLPTAAYALDPVNSDDIAKNVANAAEADLAAEADAKADAKADARADARQNRLYARLGPGAVVVAAAVFVTNQQKKNSSKNP